MLDIGWSEFLVIIVVLLLVVGPKDLPRIVRTFGQWSGKAKGYARDFQRTIEEAAEESELAAVRKEIEMANRELAEVQRKHLDATVDHAAEPADPQAAQFAGGTPAAGEGSIAPPAKPETALKPPPAAAASAAATPTNPNTTAGESPAGTA